MVKATSNGAITLALLVRIVVICICSMLFFNQGATYLNTGSITLDPRQLFTVARLQDNMEDVLKWTLSVGERAVQELTSSED